MSDTPLRDVKFSLEDSIAENFKLLNPPKEKFELEGEVPTSFNLEEQPESDLQKRFRTRLAAALKMVDDAASRDEDLHEAMSNDEHLFAQAVRIAYEEQGKEVPDLTLR